MSVISSRFLCSFNAEGFKCNVFQDSDRRVNFVADGDIDADGCPKAYHPNNVSGLDYLANAGHPGNWWGIATDRHGTPFIQDSTDPAPGFYVSTTAYEWLNYSKNDPRRYVDSLKVRFIVVSGAIRSLAKGVVLGCKARITDLKTNRTTDAVVADIGPLRRIGELSMAAAEAIGLNPSPKNGGTDTDHLLYELWPGTPAVIDGVTYRLIPMR